MRTHWRRENAGDRSVIWFVSVEPTRISVLSPPGVAISPVSAADTGQPDVKSGWRWGVWNRKDREDWPVIDREPPAATREIDTLAVLRLLDEELHEMVWTCLWTQLQVARRIGRQQHGMVPSEDLARAGALAVTWLQDELLSAFPERAHLIEVCQEPRDGGLEDKAPEDPSELVRPLCAGGEELFAYRSGLSARSSVVRWLAWKLLADRHDDWGPQRLRDWKPGDHLDGCKLCYDPEPGDGSVYSWDSDSSADGESATDELTHLLPAQH